MLCPRCSKYSAMRDGSRTHQCPYCGYIMRVDEVTIVERSLDGKRARELVKRLNLSVNSRSV